ncbi:MAG: pyridoxal phosphate-dependent aminotransferase [Bacteroidales bacterium]|nr:pyridoxal phosphate-dependent aminotransferase [Bacteroidales bacterium]
MHTTPVDKNIVQSVIAKSGLEGLSTGSIRQIMRLVTDIENASGVKYIRMEIGVPGLDTCDIGITAEIEALHQGVSARYPDIEGEPVLKEEASRFVKNFMGIEVSPRACIPAVGSMQGSFTVMMVANRTDDHKEGTLFIDPGFPLHKVQCNLLGHGYRAFDVYNYRGKKLKDKLESYLQDGKVSTIMYSNPNNPSWICLNDEELQIIGELCQKYDVTVVEDLAYFGMDFRKDISTPGVPPYQASAANYTDNFIILISCSKSFSYAGQRIGLIIVSDTLFNRRYPGLKRYYNSDQFGTALIYGALYCLAAGTAHSTQFGVAAILKAANEGRYNFVAPLREYAERAKVMKRLFTENGFYIVYDKDADQPVGNGFYFTVAYPGMSGHKLVEQLLYYGISAISLETTGSEHTEGIRACVSKIDRSQFPVLEERLNLFKKHH